MGNYPQDNLIRMVAGHVTTRQSDDGMPTLVGMPIVFNRLTEINGWEGRFMEQIASSALTKTLLERGDKVKVLFNHGLDPNIGDKPLGKPVRQEVTDDGLFVEVPLSDTSYNRDLSVLINDGAIDGMSFRFGVVKDEWEDDPGNGLPIRTITELRLYEYGPVTFPAYEATTVGVRSQREWNDYQARLNTLYGAALGTPAHSDPALSQSLRKKVSKGDIQRLIRKIDVARKDWKV
jgi:HK97 family phage prohead protease